jgi:hypothetical protein
VESVVDYALYHQTIQTNSILIGISLYWPPYSIDAIGPFTFLALQWIIPTQRRLELCVRHPDRLTSYHYELQTMTMHEHCYKYTTFFI